MKPGHGDHWLAAAEPDDPRLQDALAPPLDAPDAVALHRAPFSGALDLVQVTARRRLVTAYPEPRATALVEGTPRRLDLWETRVEGWLTFEHPGAGALTAFLTDLAEAAPRWQAARPGVRLELAGLAYHVAPRAASARPPRLAPAAADDPRFLPDDYAFDAVVEEIHEAGDERVLDLLFQNGLRFPVVARHAERAKAGERVQGHLWLAARLPAAGDAGALGKGL